MWALPGLRRKGVGGEEGGKTGGGKLEVVKTNVKERRPGQHWRDRGRFCLWRLGGQRPVDSGVEEKG